MKIFSILFLIGLFFCQKTTTKNNSLDLWVKNRSLYYKVISFSPSKNCDSSLHYIDKIETEEFKRLTIIDKIKCSENKKKIKEYILDGLNLGIPFNKMLKKNDLNYHLYSKLDTLKIINKFWSDKDTLHLSEFDKRYIKDQIFMNNKVIDTSEKIENIIDSNTRFIVNYVHINGYPYIPDEITLNRKKMFIRSPDILSIHTDEKTRAFLMKSAINMASNGKLSWHSPLIICSSFFTNISSLSTTKPIRFIYIDKYGKIKREESKLQLLAIKEVYNREVPNMDIFLKDKKDYKILIQPSEKNNFSKKKIKRQLSIIEEMLINDYNFDPKLLNTSLEYFCSEKQNFTADLPFFFTLTTITD